MAEPIEKKNPGGPEGRDPNRMPGGSSVGVVKERKQQEQDEERRRMEEEMLALHKRRQSIERSPPSKKPRKEAEGGLDVTVESEEDEMEVVAEVGAREEKKIDEARRILQGMEDLIVDVFHKAKVKKEYRDMLLDAVKNMRSVVVDMEIEAAMNRGRLAERGELMRELRKVGHYGGGDGQRAGAITYAIAAGAGRALEGGSRENRERSMEVVITGEGKDPEDIRRDLVRGNPEGLGVRVERMIKTRKGLVVAVSGKEDAERLKTNEELKRKGYVVKDGLRKNPMIMVYDLEKGRVEEDTLKEIFQRNFRETSMSEMEFLRDVKVRRKIKQVGRQ